MFLLLFLFLILISLVSPGSHRQKERQTEDRQTGGRTGRKGRKGNGPVLRVSLVRVGHVARVRAGCEAGTDEASKHGTHWSRNRRKRKR